MKNIIGIAAVMFVGGALAQSAPSIDISNAERLRMQSAEVRESLGADWTLIATGQTMVVFFNTRSVRKEGGALISAWFFWSYLDPAIADNGKNYLSSRTLELIDCEREASATKALTRFSDRRGESAAIEDINYKASYTKEALSRVAPKTLGEIIVKSACTTRPK